MTQALENPTIPAAVIGQWNIDPVHTEIGFTVRHLMTKVRGHFAEFGGVITIGADLASSSARTTVTMASVDTRSEMRDNHVRSAEIFDVENHPTMEFVSTGIRARSEQEFYLDGDLTVRGVTRPITLEAEYLGHDFDPFGHEKIGFSATAKLSRKDYGMEFNIPLQGDKVLLSDEINILIDVQAIKAK